MPKENLPIVTLDFTNHPMYSTMEYYKHLAKIWKAEVTMVSFTTGTMRVRLLNDDGTYFKKNMDTSVCYIVGSLEYKL
jgi:hypothetical protein